MQSQYVFANCQEISEKRLTKRKDYVILYLQALQNAKKRGDIMRNYLLTLRKEKNLTQKELAQKLDVSESYYNQIENGERQKNMDISLVNRLSLVLEVPITTIIEHENELRRNT